MIEEGELAGWLGLTDPTDDQVSILKDLEERAVAFVEQETGRYFGPEIQFVEILEGRGTPFLWLNEPATTITTVEERWRPGDAWTAITDYEQRGPKLVREDGLVWRYQYEYRVTYDFGYELGMEPGEIRQLVIDLVKLKWDRRTTREGVESEQVGPMRISYAKGGAEGAGEAPWVRETIEAWRWPRVA